MATELTERRLRVGGLERRYLIERDAGGRERPAMVVLMLHGGSGSADDLAPRMDLFEHGDPDDLVVVYPDGYEKSWNAGPGPDGESPNWGPAFEKDIDDVAFVEALLDDLSTVVAIDPARVFAAGWSNGTAMAMRLGCELGDRIAAVAGCFSELSLHRPRLVRPVPVMYFYGTADPIQRVGSPPKDEMAARTMRTWVELNRCDPTPVEVHQQGAATRTTWRGDDPRSVVVQWRLEGAGHWWPGLPVRDPSRQQLLLSMFGPLCRDVTATAEILRFFALHPLGTP